MSLSQKLTDIAQNVPKVYGAGQRQAQGVCAAEHFTAQVSGDGSTALSFACPFMPDMLQVAGSDPRAFKKSNVIAVFAADLRSVSVVAGNSASYRSDSNSMIYLGLATSGLKSKVLYEDGILTLTGLPGISTTAKGYFLKDAVYTVSAVRYTDKTDRQLLEEFVLSLTGSGTVSLCAAKVAAAFETASGAADGQSSPDWKALTNQRPDWTFTYL